ncbi:MAG: protein kinase domain-containing protein [Planctomycetota bacterium]
MEGKELGAYRIQAELGSGGMGKVYKALDDNGDTVALKIVHPHLLEAPGFFKRFLREAEAGRRIEHPNVVRTLDVDATVLDDRHYHYLVMEYVEGQTLSELLGELERVPEVLCRHIGREVAVALEAIHAAGVVHRDLKPENVLITPDQAIKVMDLSVASLADEAMRLSQHSQFVGSLFYAAPEQFLMAEVDGRADYYALGLILYELATGQNPLGGETFAEAMQRALNETPRPAAEIHPQLSPFLEELLKALLEKESDRRPSGVREILERGEDSTWWKERVTAIRLETQRPLRRIRIPRETALCGREEELALLRRLYEAASAGQAKVALIEGEAGIGKTRLVDEFVARLRQDGEDVHFLFGSYPHGGTPAAAGAFSEAYREQFGTAGSSAYLSATPLLVPAFDALLNGEPPPRGEEPLNGESLQTAFVHATRALAAEKTTVVLAEDLNGAPEEGRALFARLALAAPGHRVLLLGTARPGLPEEWRASFQRQEHATLLSLARLGPKDLTSLLVDAFRSERLAEELGFRIAQKSDGNPFFVFEIIRGLREGQYLARADDGTWVRSRVIETIEIPDTVRQLIQARIAELTEEDREVLDVAACLGFEFDPLLIGTVLSLSDIPLLRRLGHLEQKHRLVRAVGRRFVFDHHQVQESIYEGLSELLRERYHAAVADALERREEAVGEPDGALAYELCDHSLRGAENERASRYLEAALRYLEQSWRNEQAVKLTERALEVPGLVAGDRRVNVLMRRAERLRLLGRRAAQRDALDEALALVDQEADPLPRARVRIGLGILETDVSRYDAAEEAIQEACALARSADDRELEARALTNLGLVFDGLGRYADALAVAEQAQAVFRELELRDEEASAAGNIANVHRGRGRFEEARRGHERCRDAFEELGNRQSLAASHSNLGVDLHHLGRFEEARRNHDRSRQLARDVGDRRGEARAVYNLAVLDIELGDPARARQRFDEYAAIAQELGDRHALARSWGGRGVVLQELGLAGEAQREQERSLAAARELGAARGEGYALHNLARLAQERGELEEAQRLVDEALAVRRRIGQREATAESLLLLGTLAADRGDLESARARVAEARALADELNHGETIVLATARALRLDGGDAEAASNTMSTYETRVSHKARMEIRFLLWQATKDRAHLEEAHRLLSHLIDHSPDDCRETMVENVTLHREIQRAWDALS